MKPDKVVEAAAASLRFEGLYPTEEEMERAKRVAAGEETLDQAMKEVLAKYQK